MNTASADPMKTIRVAFGLEQTIKFANSRAPIHPLFDRVHIREFLAAAAKLEIRFGKAQSSAPAADHNL